MSDFYIQPPSKGASVAEWQEWMEAEKRKAAAVKAAATRALEYVDTPDELQATETRRVGGRWVQALAMGFSGSSDEGTLAGEVLVDADQDRQVVWADMESKRCKRGRNNRAGMSARRRKNAKARRKAKG